MKDFSDYAQITVFLCSSIIRICWSCHARTQKDMLDKTIIIIFMRSLLGWVSEFVHLCHLGTLYLVPFLLNFTALFFWMPRFLLGVNLILRSCGLPQEVSAHGVVSNHSLRPFPKPCGCWFIFRFFLESAVALSWIYHFRICLGRWSRKLLNGTFQSRLLDFSWECQ